MSERRNPIWLLPNLLSLDAPLVGLVWMWMLVRALRVDYMQSAAWFILPAAIWCVYVLDRLIDSWLRPEQRQSSPRHIFHWRWRWPFLIAVVVVAIVCAYQALFELSRSMLSAGMVAAVLCVFYFLMASFQSKQIPYFKNLLAGMIFAMGVGIPVNAANASLLVTDLNDIVYAFNHMGWLDAGWNFLKMVISTLIVIFYESREIWVFGLLCMLNITAIDLWERASVVEDDEVASSHEQNLTLGLIVLAGGALLFAVMFADQYTKPFFYAIMVAAAVLQGINHYRERLSMNSLRVLADVALLVPIPIFLAS
jgi:hypothetical protein